ncbi:MAG: hypothetical protein H6628_16805 [Calditrichae bacterium]|nr:hypothetical protein [Calditrichia bacterium]
MPSQQNRTAAAAETGISATHLKQLSPRERLIASLLFYEKLTVPETASILQLPEEAVRLLLMQILSRLADSATAANQPQNRPRPSEIIR